MKQLSLIALSVLGLLICLKLIIVSVAGVSCGFLGCDTVLTSSYATLFGVSLSAIGFGAYAVLLLLTALKRYRTLFRCLSAAVVSVIVLFGIQALVLSSWCLYCVMSSCVLVLMFGLSLSLKDEEEPPIELNIVITILLLAFLGVIVEGVVSHSLKSTTYALKVDGVTFTLSEVDAELGLSGVELENQKNELREKWLRAYLVEKDTSQRGMTKSQLYAELVSQYKSNIVDGLRKYEDSLYEKYNVDVRFPLPTLVDIPDNRFGAIQSEKVNPFHIVEFIDLECGHCRKIHSEIKTLKEAYPEKISIEVRHFPLKSHEHSKQAAQIAWCMNNQQLGMAYVDSVFEFEGALSPEVLLSIALDKGAHRERLLTCVSEPVSFDALEEDIRIAKDLGVTGTPAVFLNNRFVRSIADIESTIKKAR